MNAIYNIINSIKTTIMYKLQTNMCENTVSNLVQCDGCKGHIPNKYCVKFNIKKSQYIYACFGCLFYRNGKIVDKINYGCDYGKKHKTQNVILQDESKCRLFKKWNNYGYYYYDCFYCKLDFWKTFGRKCDTLINLNHYRQLKYQINKQSFENYFEMNTTNLNMKDRWLNISNTINENNLLLMCGKKANFFCSKCNSFKCYKCIYKTNRLNTNTKNDLICSECVYGKKQFMRPLEEIDIQLKQKIIHEDLYEKVNFLINRNLSNELYKFKWI